MRTIEVTVDVGADGTLVLRAPSDVRPGRHRATLTLVEDDEQARLDAGLAELLAMPPLLRGPWPADLSLRRADLYGDEGR
jgi:hypothetical protein